MTSCNTHAYTHLICSCLFCNVFLFFLIFQEYLFREHSLSDGIESALKLLQLGAERYLPALRTSTQSVLGIAELRCALNQFVCALCTLMVRDPDETSLCQVKLQDLLTEISELKTKLSPSVYSYDMVTAFLVRAITRKHGYSCFISICGMDEVLSSRILPNVYSYVSVTSSYIELCTIFSQVCTAYYFSLFRMTNLLIHLWCMIQCILKFVKKLMRQFILIMVKSRKKIWWVLSMLKNLIQ